MTGEKDPHRDFTHGNQGLPRASSRSPTGPRRRSQENGFEKVKRTMLPGVGHSALQREVWEYVDEIRGD